MAEHQSRSETLSTMRRIFPYLTPYRGRFIAALLAMTIYGASDGALPFLIKLILDKIFGEQQQQWLLPLAVGVVIFAALRGIFGFVQKYLSASVGLDIVKDLRNDINRKLLELSESFFSRHQTGALISRITNDTLLVRMTLTDAVAAMIRDTIRIVALLIAAFYLDPLLALIAFVGFPLGLLPVLKFGRRVRKLSKTGQDQLGGLTSLLQETIVGHKVVQGFSMEQFEQRRFEGESQRLTSTLQRSEKYAALSGPTNETIASIAIALILLYGGYSVIGGVRTQGDFIAFLTAMFLLYEPIKKLSRVNNIVQTGVGAAQRIFEVLDARPDISDRPDATTLALPERFEIAYRDVSFRYGEMRDGVALSSDEAQRWVLDDINLNVKAGQTLALVGMSGGGKSTLVDLLPRFYDPQQGSITIAGTDIREYSVTSLRNVISIVGQHTFLFNDTVFNNIVYGAPQLIDSPNIRDAVEEAARAANAHRFIERLPEGYDTVIGEQGLRLSGGERQRIAIARALLKNAPILILDEATAALDSESERLVQEAIEHLMQGRTALVIAHRLATIRNADSIAVVVQGRIVEHGSHDELLAAGGEYAKLYRMQFEGSAQQVA